MAYPRLIPCLDVADGRVVKGIQFQSLRDVGDPVELAAAYSERGADELVLLDIKASLRGVRALIDVVERVADAVTIPLTVGGGVRTCEDAQRLIEAGADRVSINTAALDRPALLGEVAALFGSQAVVAAIDTRAGEVFSHAGTTPTGIDVFAWARRVVTEGAGEILLTAIDADGRQAGYDLVTTAGVRAVVTVGVIASGGAGGPAHVVEALGVADAAIVASIVHDDPSQFTSLRTAIVAGGVSLRPIKGAVA